MTRALTERLARDRGFDLTAILVSFRGRGRLGSQLPAGVGERALTFPARLAHQLWSRIDRPSVGGFDLVHGPNFVVPPARGAAELVTIHDFGPWHYPELVSSHSRAYPSLVARALARGAHVHVVSSFVGHEAGDLLELEPERIHHIANGFDPGLVGDGAGGRARMEGRYVVAVGTIEPRKDFPTLVAAMAQVWREVPDLRLALIGGDGWGTADLETALARVAAGDRVVRLGYVSDQVRADLVAGATCLAFPSRYEGFGLPPLEAMAQATPVVATSIGAVTEVCGQAALLVEPGDVEGLARAIVSIASDDHLASRLVEEGRQRLPLFSWDRAAAELARLYHHLVGR
jgi:glycosyltransferase involved in cell wall biosynthesis